MAMQFLQGPFFLGEVEGRWHDGRAVCPSTTRSALRPARTIPWERAQ